MNGKYIFACFVILLPIGVFCLLQKFYLPFLNYNLTPGLLILLIVSPILEELTFRGLLQDLVLSKTKNYIFTILIVNIAFMLLHFNVNKNIVYLLLVFTCGIIFSVSKIYYERISLHILLHMYYNLCFIVYTQAISL